MIRISFICLLLLGAVLISGCKSNDQVKFNKLSSSDFGLGISFEMSKDQVLEVLAEPATSLDKQGGTRVIDFYIHPDVLSETPDAEYPTDSDTPQLQLTYINGYLARIYNRWIPEDPDQPYPPFFMEPVAGVKLGSRRSDMQEALGPPTDPIIGNWKFKHKDGRMIQIDAAYTEMPNTEEELCSSLSIVLVPSVTDYQGEEKEKRDNWRQDFDL